jgi:Zn-dependent protease with chaperone function
VLEAVAGFLLVSCAVLALTPLAGAPPWLAIWLSLIELALRPLTALVGGLLVLVYLPQAASFAAAVRSGVHADLPLGALHISFGGHAIGDLAALLPLIAIMLGVCWSLLAAVRDTIAMHRYLRRLPTTAGPEGSIVVRDEQFLLAATAVGPKRVLVSSGAIASLDPDELDAALAHERAHLRRHRLVASVGAGLVRMSRFLPGASNAYAQLRFSLERDADITAVRHTGDPHALASAICKGALGGRAPGLLLLRGETSTSARVRALYEAPFVRSRARVPSPPTMLLPALTLSLSASVLAWVLGEPTGLLALKRLAALCVAT